MKTFWCFLFLVFINAMLFGQDWEANFDAAQSKALQENKLLVVVFSGSDWCAPCIKLDREVWQTATFIKVAKQHYVLYRADFPRKKKHQLSEELQKKNSALAAKYNPKGHFPLVLVLGNDASVLGSMGYEKGGAQKYIDYLDAFLP
jgi:thioredoxin-related protein